VVTVGQDRTIRVWERTEDMVFVDEEKERFMEAQIEASINKDAGLNDTDGEAGALSASLRSLESVKGGERLMEAMDIAAAELKALQDLAKKQSCSIEEAAKSRRQSNPVLLGMTPYKFLTHTLRQIKAPDMEQALLVLPFHYVTRLLRVLLELTERSLDLEQCARICIFLLRCHYARISTTAELVPVLVSLKSRIGVRLTEYRGLIGSNVAGLKIMQREVQENATAHFIDLSDAVLPGTAGPQGGKNKSQKKRKHKD